MLWRAEPSITTRFFEMTASSTASMSSIIINGRVHGKESSITSTKNTRAILPLPSILQVLDVVLSKPAHAFLSSHLGHRPECFIGALPRTQSLDIAHSMQYVLEKGLDNFGRAACAQSDIEKFYDSLPVLRIVRWLVSRGMSAGLAACILRHQMCPRILLSCGKATARIGKRSIGGLTGSRVAGFLGRVPVEAIASERSVHWKRWGFHFAQHTLCLSTWVDNIFSVSDSLSGAIRILEDFEDQLRKNWCMKVKDSSRSCIVADGCLDLPEDTQKWPLSSTFNVLGHTLQSSGSIRACWSNTRRCLWRAFWSNPGARTVRHLGLDSKLRLLQRAVTPALDFRCSRWPPQPQIARELDIVQRKMISSIMRIERGPVESIDLFHQRRGRVAAQVARDQGLWSRRWWQRAQMWDEHLARSRNSSAWSSRLRTHRDRRWFTERRANLLGNQHSQSALSVTAGRTQTRTAPGKVHMRWHDGIHLAKDHLVPAWIKALFQ